MNGFKYRLQRFFSGRYGIDSFGYFLLAVYAILCVLNAFFRTYVIQLITIVIAIYAMYRLMSRNFYKRSAENRKFLKLWGPVKTELKLFIDRFKYIKTSRFRKCKHCKAIIKLPYKKGKHTVRCPKCGQRFDVTIL